MEKSNIDTLVSDIPDMTGRSKERIRNEINACISGEFIGAKIGSKLEIEHAIKQLHLAGKALDELTKLNDNLIRSMYPKARNESKHKATCLKNRFKRKKKRKNA